MPTYEKKNNKSIGQKGVMNIIISRTPFRISFFGGSTDFPAYYKDHKAAVLATSIDKYCYLQCRFFPPFFPHKYHITYSKIERANNIDEIIHPSVRETLNFMKINQIAYNKANK